MVRKTEKDSDPKSSGAGLFDSALAAQVRESAQQIWLAGMGAFAKAQAEGRQVFEALVKEGTSLQSKTQTAAEERLGEMTHRMASVAGEVSARAGQQWDKLESIFEERTAKALKRLGVPVAQDLDALSARIEALGAQVARLEKAAGKPTVRRKVGTVERAPRTALKRPAVRKTP